MSKKGKYERQGGISAIHVNESSPSGTALQCNGEITELATDNRGNKFARFSLTGEQEQLTSCNVHISSFLLQCCLDMI